MNVSLIRGEGPGTDLLFHHVRYGHRQWTMSIMSRTCTVARVSHYVHTQQLVLSHAFKPNWAFCPIRHPSPPTTYPSTILGPITISFKTYSLLFSDTQKFCGYFPHYRIPSNPRLSASSPLPADFVLTAASEQRLCRGLSTSASLLRLLCGLLAAAALPLYLAYPHFTI